MILSIDEKDVRGKGVGEMRNFIVGPEGSTVNLGFMREGEQFSVALLRGSPEYIASVMLLPSILIVLGLNIFMWRRDKPDRVTFDKMVSENLKEFFDKINTFYANETE